ncbi:MAG: NUDIX hydrolase [Paracoccaceae bacterium]
METTEPKPPAPIRDAATVIVVQQRPDGASVLMGQRNRGAIFMPGKFVFPGGAVDPADADIFPAMSDDLTKSLSVESSSDPRGLAAAAIRELWEETGQIIGTPGDWPDAPPAWQGFAAAGYRPDATPLSFFFRAVTPAGRPRRFDARFFLASAKALCTDPDDFSQADDELSHLQWINLDKARHFDLPFITQVVLAELRAHLANPKAPYDPPFFRNDDEALHVQRLAGRSPL